MALSVVDLYRDVLPKTNCRECGFSTCIAFAGMVVSQKHPLGNCPHLDQSLVERCSIELNEQYREGKWLKKDMAEDALAWAKKRSTSMKIEDLPDRMGGELAATGDETVLVLPYFNSTVVISQSGIFHRDGSALTRWEQVFLYNHMAQGGSSMPTGKWKGLVEFPNTVSKIKSMIDKIEIPIMEAFRGKGEKLMAAGKKLGGKELPKDEHSADIAVKFTPLPRVPVLLMFTDEDKEENFSGNVKLLFDETITDHLDIESIMFLSERLKQLLCEAL